MRGLILGASPHFVFAAGSIRTFRTRCRLAFLGEEPEKPLSPFLTSGDLTMEGLAKNWQAAHPSLGVFTAERGTFTAGHGMNDNNRLRTAAMLSELWDGKPVKRIRTLYRFHN